jgi:hypothetical protein
MRCYICDTPAQPIVHPDFSEYACPHCGTYKISATAMVLFEMHNWKFNVVSARHWITRQLQAGEAPLIDSQRAVFLT